jgi:hypothetical protein
MEANNLNKGSKVLFVDDKGSGMVSTVEDNKPNEFISFKHLGVVIDGVEQLDNPKYKDWAGILENYTLQTVNDQTSLVVEMGMKGVPADMQDYFQNTWPKALSKVKELAEKN